MTPAAILDLVAAFIFALNGGLVASRAQLDVVGFLFLACLSNLNKTYGSLGAISALMFWFYVSALVVLLGAEMNAEMELQTTRDTTTGPPRPMGDRGAYVADHVA